MDTIRTLYKIGYGPSSSHTMGPRKAAGTFKAAHADAVSFRVTLYGSLAATGRGHFTDKAIEAELAPKAVEIVWNADIVPEYHTNGMLYEALDASGAVTDSKMYYSIGGGIISEGPSDNVQTAKETYTLSRCADILGYVTEYGLSFWEYVEWYEGKDIWGYLKEIWDQMQTSIKEGLDNDGVLPGGLFIRSQAKQNYLRASRLNNSLKGRALVTSYALAVSEQNARGGKVVTAPTCGSCGVVPAVLYHIFTAHDASEKDILKALATAGLFGNLIRTNASVSGAEVGCQGEVGSACVMAAVAACQLFGGSPEQIANAAEMAMEHNLGLTCDPVCGLVQVPCIERNAFAALRALDTSLYALMNDGRHLVDFDTVIDTMKKTGLAIPDPYKETSVGGLAEEIKY